MPLLNMNILADAMKDKVTAFSEDSEIELNLRSTCVYSTKLTNIKPDCIYVISASEYDELRGRFPEGYFAVSDVDKTFIPVNTDIRTLFFQTGITIEDAYDLIEHIFVYYESWQYQVCCAVVQEKSIQSIFDLIVSPLRNPVALFTPSLALVCVSGYFSNHNIDTVWKGVLAKGYFETDVYVDPEIEQLRQTRRPFFWQFDDVRTLGTCIWLDDEIQGFLALTELTTPFNQYSCSVLYMIQKLLEEMRFLHPGNSYESKNLGFLIDHLLKGLPVVDDTISHYFRLKKWDREDYWQLFYLYYPNNETMEKTTADQLVRYLERRYPLSIAMQYEEGICLIQHAKHKEDIPGISELDNFMKKNHLIGAISDIFRPIKYLHSAYLQCRAVLELKREMREGDWEIFEHTFSEYILSQLQSVTELKFLCDPTVFEIQSKKNGNEYIKNLCAFLMNGRSITLAANSLYMHRNTLIYRIEQMEKILGIRLSEINEERQFRLYFSCLVALAMAEANDK